MLLATKEASIAGKYLTSLGMILFGDQYRWISAPILIILGTMIIVKKASWSGSRFAGLLIFFLAVTSLLGMLDGDIVGFFDLHEQAVRFFGPSASVLGFMTLFFVSLWMTLRISYRTLLSRVRAAAPSLSSVRQAVLPDDEDEAPVRKSKVDDVYRKKAEELERKLENLQKSKTPPKSEK